MHFSSRSMQSTLYCKTAYHSRPHKNVWCRPIIWRIYVLTWDRSSGSINFFFIYWYVDNSRSYQKPVYMQKYLEIWLYNLENWYNCQEMGSRLYSSEFLCVSLQVDSRLRKLSVLHFPFSKLRLSSYPQRLHQTSATGY